MQAQLTLLDPETHTELPPLIVRIVPGQHDDLLVAAPDLDAWGWSPHEEYFSIACRGLALKRDSRNVRK